MSTTVPQPFSFHNPKSTAKMRRYLDAENQLINPTLKNLRPRSVASNHQKRDAYSPVERDEKEKPAMTQKFSAYIGQRRKQMEDKKVKEEEKF